MSDQPASSAPNFNKAGMGAKKVTNVVDQRVTKLTTVNQAGIPHKVFISFIVGVFAILCVVIAGFLLQTLTLRPPQKDVPAPASSLQGQTSTSTSADKEEKDHVDQAPKPSDTPLADQTARLAPDVGTTKPYPPPSASSENLKVVFDREDRLYYDQDRQGIFITVPKNCYLYAASVWANGQMRILSHPALLEPSPGAVEAGRKVEIFPINMSFTPPDPAAEATEEEIRVVLSDQLVPGIPAERKADIRLAWEAAFGVEIGSPHERMRVRGGELPEPRTQKAAGILQYTAPYRMRRGPRPAPSPAP